MTTTTITEKLIGTASTFGKPFQLSSIPDFPNTDYQELQAKYSTLEEWFTGEALDTEQVLGDRNVDLYPLKINPIRIAAFKHSYALFGEFTDDNSGPLAQPKVVITDTSDKTAADTIEEALGKVMYDNNVSSLMMENGVLSQVYGGCIFKVSFVPDDLERPIRIEAINPKEFIGVPRGIDYWSLREAWIVRQIDETEAKAQGVPSPIGDMYYIEHWTETEYSIAINEMPILFGTSQDKYKKSYTNPFGFVPFVYIPHQRTGEFYGDSMITEAAMGITKELNLRTADAGDATNDQSHSVIAVRNIRGSAQIQRLTNGIQVVNLGGNQSLTGGESEPDMFSVTRSSITEPMLRLNQELRSDIRRELFVPPVAEGEDEGSQRSAATLVLRMWPLTTHIKSERVYWTTGLIILCKMTMKILAEKNLYKITKKHLEAKLKIKWAPILPRDRQAFVEEMVARAGVNLGSPEHLLALIGDVEDIDIVMKQMKDWLTFLEEVKATAAQKAFKEAGGQDGSESNIGGPQGAFGNRGRPISNSNKAASDKRSEASGTREGQSRAKSDNQESS